MLGLEPHPRQTVEHEPLEENRIVAVVEGPEGSGLPHDTEPAVEEFVDDLPGGGVVP